MTKTTICLLIIGCMLVGYGCARADRALTNYTQTVAPQMR